MYSYENMLHARDRCQLVNREPRAPRKYEGGGEDENVNVISDFSMPARTTPETSEADVRPTPAE